MSQTFAATTAPATASDAPRSAQGEPARPSVREAGFRLLVESLAPGARATAAELPALAVPAGVSYLAPGREPLELACCEPRAAAFALEPVRVDAHAGGRARLLMLSPEGLRAWRNGQTAPAVALLQVGDQLQLDERAILHVTQWRSAEAITTPSELVGRPCGVCRLPLSAETTVQICACGLPLHLEGPSEPEGERLECARLGCPSCGAALPTESGPVWLPEL